VADMHEMLKKRDSEIVRKANKVAGCVWGKEKENGEVISGAK
jgi:ribosomal protein L25 (general stress protein Ctc)